MSRRLSKPKVTHADLFSQIIKPIVEKDQAFTVFQEIDKIEPGPIKDLIVECYKHHELWVRVLGTLMNGVVSSRKSIFLLSRKFLIQYFESDPNFSGPKGISGETAREIVDQLLARMSRGESFLKMERPPSKVGGNDARAGLYSLS